LPPGLAMKNLADLLHLVLIAGIVTMTGAQKTHRHHVIDFIRGQGLERQMQSPTHLRERRLVCRRALGQKVLQCLRRIVAGARPEDRELPADRQELAEIRPGVSVLSDKRAPRAPVRQPETRARNLSIHGPILDSFWLSLILFRNGKLEWVLHLSGSGNTARHAPATGAAYLFITPPGKPAVLRTRRRCSWLAGNIRIGTVVSPIRPQDIFPSPDRPNQPAAIHLVGYGPLTVDHRSSILDQLNRTAAKQRWATPSQSRSRSSRATADHASSSLCSNHRVRSMGQWVNGLMAGQRIHVSGRPDCLAVISMVFSTDHGSIFFSKDGDS
jgi:hypothetical protein